ncbi:hypothetical protein [uncultured Pseudomonas sp.]|uniref:hypothetical protein n=1 Tax=uncultured Pseudomonas sp. TaxID=114707 RepID=UPI0025CDDFC9|nr:hypothetical protein [uncultured Pseudomonas sp.]
MKSLDSKREIVPAWSKSKDASKTREVNSIKNKKSEIAFTDSTDEILKEFKRNQETGIAAELLNIALIEDRPDEALMAAEALVGSPTTPIPIQNLSRKLLNLPPIGEQQLLVSEVATLKRRIANNNRDPLAWVDLSRHYAVSGNHEKAERAMLIALQLNNGHRWISRVASRLFVQLNDPDKAHYYLHRNPNLRSDPWLIASEMAVSRISKRPLKLWSLAKKLSESKITPIHLSELNSSIATSEFNDGANKKAKHYFQQSLIDPTQNSLAQAKWAERHSSLALTKLVSPLVGDGTGSHEVKYWESYNSGDVHQAYSHAKCWFDEEPYSATAANFLIHTASVLNQLEVLYETADRARHANPDNTTVQLNFIYAWAATKNLKKASLKDHADTERYLKFLKAVLHGENKDDAAHSAANAGMLLYRSGHEEYGRSYYEHAEMFFKKNSPATQPMLILNHAREALIAEVPWATEVLQHAKDVLETDKAICTPALKFYLDTVEALSSEPGSWRERFSRPILPPEAKKPDRESTIIKVASDFSSMFWLPEKISAPSEVKKLLDPDRKLK